ncbi:YjbF family lipoprotein [Thalassococcus sp. S3]|uniref:YjbF family lipoprotein n=1 Tax=Thalassococcus sp. S3 TaxID=2017482 RepID=UPI001023FBA9|nr:YjbF family lipoprotein [Thalassococcus sp. S3]QBF34197.1 hypothetical protein CFI11_23725 [Thalassococcus sp. S3]
MKRTYLMALAVAAFALSACSSSDEQGSTTIALIQTLQETIVTRSRARPARPALTRDLINRVPGPVLEVVREQSDGAPSFLSPVARRTDSGVGEVVTWTDSATATLTFRSDLLIATRGLGGDILSSEVSPSIAALSNRSGGGQRIHFVRAEDNKKRRVSFACTVADQGPETLNIVGLVVQTRHIREDCVAPSGRIVNDYWVDSRGGPIWKSRQWGGPVIGYFNIRRLK